MSTVVHHTPLSNPLSARDFFRHFSDKSWAMLLDSGRSDHVDANLDIIVFEPIITLVSDDEKTTVTDMVKGSSYHTTDNPFDVLAHELSNCGLGDSPSEFAF